MKWVLVQNIPIDYCRAVMTDKEGRAIKFDSKYEAEEYIQEHELKPYIREDLDDIMAVPEKEEPIPSNADC
jgi:hypothetical protein